jgi:hypothetical protein
MFGQFLAGSGQINAVAGPFEESHPETLLELAYLMGNGRLGEVEHPCCSCEASVLSHLEKSLERIKLEGAHGKLTYRAIKKFVFMQLTFMTY